jgi:ATP-dependent helicase/nuclease subunit A
VSELVTLPKTAALEAASDAQRAAAHPFASAWVAANAGSGKTKVLIDRVARLLLRGDVDPDHILCVTYTKAAANEMLSRLFKRLGEWSTLSEARLQEELRKLEGAPDKTYSADALRTARTLFARALETPGGLRIETIHAFCARVLRRFPLEAGVAPGFSEIEEVEADALWREAVAEVLNGIDDEPELAHALDTLAAASGSSGASGALDLIRGARETLSEHAARHGGDLGSMAAELSDYLRAPEASEGEILSRFFADLPHGEIRSSIGVLSSASAKKDASFATALESVLDETDPAKAFETYRTIAYTSTGDPAKQSAFSNPADTASGGLLAELFLVHHPEKPDKEGRPVGREVTRLLAAEDRLKRRRAFERTLALYRLGQPIIAAYGRLKRARAVLDFDDLISATERLLTTPGRAEWVLYKLDGKLSHILLDEAQDTSPRQWTLINALTGEFFSGEGSVRRDTPRTQFVVGDEKQSIYSFQGADPDHFGEERRECADRVHASGARFHQPQMEMSFRSTPEVLRFVDEAWSRQPVAEGAGGREMAPLEADLVRHVAHRSTLKGSVELRGLQHKEEAEEPDPWTAPVDKLSSASPKLALARWVASRCKEIVSNGEAVWEEAGKGQFAPRPAGPGDILILVAKRTGGLFEALIGELKAAGLPVAGADRLKPTDHIGVQDCLNLIRFAIHPAGDLVLAELLKSPLLNLIDDEAHIAPIARGRGEGQTLWQALRASESGLYDEAREFLSALIEARHLPPHGFLTRALQHRFADGSRARDRLVTRLGTPVLDPLEELLSGALDHDARSAPSLQVFLSEQDRATADIKRDLARPEGEVRVMTVHGAKGLEAPIVILADTTAPPGKNERGLLTGLGAPPILAGKKADEVAPEMTDLKREAARKAMAEHNRLLYVALTRAQDRLIICGAEHGASKTGMGEGCWYQTCAAAMDALAHETLEGAEGEPSIRVHGTLPPTLGEAAALLPARVDPPAWADRNAAQPADGLHITPSSKSEARYPALGPFADTGTKRFLRGTLIHSLLEFLPERPQPEWTEAATRFMDGVRDLSATEREEIAGAALSVLNDPDFAEVFGPGSRAEVPVAGRLADGRLVEGRVDRLVVGARDVMIVDFKTDRPPPHDASGVDPGYLVQMAAYRAVLAAAFPGRDIRCALLWTDAPRLMELSPDALDKAITDARDRLQA